MYISYSPKWGCINTCDANILAVQLCYISPWSQRVAIPQTIQRQRGTPSPGNPWMHCMLPKMTTQCLPSDKLT